MCKGDGESQDECNAMCVWRQTLHPLQDLLSLSPEPPSVRVEDKLSPRHSGVNKEDDSLSYR